MELRPATPEEARSRDALSFSSWGRPQLTLEQYLGREEFLRTTAWSRSALQPWVLIDGGEIVASCETYRMESRAGGKGGATYGVASVFVDDRLRRRGYAGEMMRRLVSHLRGQGAQASILFSEVGASLYERAGYVAKPAITRAWPAARSDLAAQPLGDRDLAALLDAADRRSFDFRVRISREQLDWHFARADYYRRVLGRKEARAKAVKAGSSWAILYPDHRNGRIALLDFEPGSADETFAVIAAAADEAAWIGLAEVTVIENPNNAAALVGGVRRTCDDGVPMILALAAGLGSEAWCDYVRGCWI
jgi:predicted N-acetyltransferase YhbS